MLFTEFARAKINLTLHVTGQRSDGYHTLDSLVMFASVGDHLDLNTGEPRGLTVTGPLARGIPTDATNSILKVAETLLPRDVPGAFRLRKALPSSAGIGGGTADAAATLRLIARAYPDLWNNVTNLSSNDPRLSEISQKALNFGADVPVCLFSLTARMQGIGEKLELLDDLPSLNAVLINPGVSVSTPQIFKSMTHKSNPPMPDDLPKFPDANALTAWLADQRNDMQDAARAAAPEVDQVLGALSLSSGCTLARMSGSGATCFGLFDTQAAQTNAAASLARDHPNWWVHPCALGNVS